MMVESIVYYSLGFIALIVVVYVLARTASVAYFRAKMDHLRATLRELNGGMDGKE